VSCRVYEMHVFLANLVMYYVRVYKQACCMVIVSNLALESKYLEIETMGKCLVTISNLASDSNYSEMETKGRCFANVSWGRSFLHNTPWHTPIDLLPHTFSQKISTMVQRNISDKHAHHSLTRKSYGWVFMIMNAMNLCHPLFHYLCWWQWLLLWIVWRFQSCAVEDEVVVNGVTIHSTVVVVLLWIVWWFIPLFVVVLLMTIVVVELCDDWLIPSVVVLLMFIVVNCVMMIHSFCCCWWLFV
jgi:hypothetical protein